jgi:nondiscriminating aspartyl-tRNA synthetase
VEVHHPRVELVAKAEQPPIFDLFRPTIHAQLPTILGNAALSIRHPRRRALLRLLDASVHAFATALRSEGFTQVFTSKLVAGATEGGANVFKVDYFGQPAFLAQSPQLYKQLMVGAFERVFEIGPVFRAEPHDTPRHLNEYTSLDVEMGFIRDHRDVIAVLNRVLAAMAEAAVAVGSEVPGLIASRPRLPAEPLVITFGEALALIGHATGEDLSAEPDLRPSDERWLGEWALREHGSDFLYVTEFPLSTRPFYAQPAPHNPALSNSFDLLFRGLELVTGGQRLHRRADYLAAMASRGVSPEPFAAYLQAFAHGLPPHGGFGLGLERWVARLAEVDNIREVTAFPRDINRLSP